MHTIKWVKKLNKMYDFCCYLQVRVFTFLIGREVSDNRNAKWMADANRGMS